MFHERTVILINSQLIKKNKLLDNKIEVCLKRGSCQVISTGTQSFRLALKKLCHEIQPN